MTIPLTDRKAGPYITNGSTTLFPYDFHIVEDAELEVYKLDTSTDAQVLLVLDTDYTVTDAGEDAGGDVVIDPALASGFEITIRGAVSLSQETDYPSQGTYHAEILEASLDKLTKISIEQQDQIARCLKIDVTDDNPLVVFDPDTGEDRFVKRQANGDFVLSTFTTGVLTGVNGFGDTASRPAGLGPSDAMVYTYYDTDLRYPIFWDGTGWASFSRAGYGIWLINATAGPVKYDTFTLAYTAAVTGDVITVGPGIHDLGEIFFEFNKAVSVVGAGSRATTLLAKGFTWAATAVDCSVQGVTFTQDVGDTGNTFFFTTLYTDELNIEWKDIFVWQKGTGDHTLEVSGKNIRLDNVRTRSATNHAFVLKGCQDIVVRNCESFIEGAGYGLYLKSHPTQKGLLKDFTIDGFKSNRALMLHVALDLDRIENGRVYNLDLQVGDGDPMLQFVGAGGITDNQINNVTIDGVSGSATRLATLTAISYISNLVIRNVNVTGLDNTADRIFIDPTLGPDWSGVVFENINMSDDSGLVYRIDRAAEREILITDFEKMWRAGDHGEYQVVTDDISNGCLSANVRAADQTATGINVVIKAGFEFDETYLAVGDPVLLEGGDHDAVYRLEDFGTVDTNDVPVTGALIGDYFIRITDLNTTGIEAVTAGNVYPGKVVFDISSDNTIQAKLFSGTVRGVGCSSALNGSSQFFIQPSLSEYEFAGSIPFAGARPFCDGTRTELAIGSFFDGSVAVPLHAHAFPYDEDRVYVGLFGGGTTDSSLVPSRLRRAELVLKINYHAGHPNSYVRSVTTLP